MVDPSTDRESAATGAPVAVHIADDVLAIAVTAILGQFGIALTDPDRPVRSSRVLITDTPRWMVKPSLLIIPTTFAAAREGYAMATRGSVNGVCARDELRTLPETITAVASGYTVISPLVMERAHIGPLLDDRDDEVLKLLADGYTNRAIAQAVHLSQATVKRRIANLLEAHGCASRAELSMVARR